MKIVTTASEMQQISLDWRQQGLRLGFVPTMGSLHEGHLRLVDSAKQLADRVILSVFVNPTQFGPNEDFEKYPRDLKRDSEMALGRGVDVVFTPGVNDIYPTGDQTQVIVTEVTRGLDGAFRPGHFRGVTTVVAKLFLIVLPHYAVFGEKDFQQLTAVRRMVKDLHFPLEVVGEPTVREASGLAMSSRNAYLNAEEKVEAANIYQAMLGVQAALQAGQRKVEALLPVAQTILGRGGHMVLDYVEIVDVSSLQPLTTVDRPARILIAVHLNGKRLIDNGPLIP